MVTYTLVAYRSDGEVNIRGCRIESWGSEFIHETCIPREELIKRIAELKAIEGLYSWDEILWFKDQYHEGAYIREYIGPDYSIMDKAMELVPGIRKAAEEKKLADSIKLEEIAKRDKLIHQRIEYEFLRKIFDTGEGQNT